jgi:hypothetical protein
LLSKVGSICEEKNLKYRITRKQRGYIIDLHSTISIQDLHLANGLLHGCQGFDESYYQIWNHANADMAQISVRMIEELAATDWAAGMSTPRMDVALVVDDHHSTSLCEHYIKKLRDFGCTWNCRIFKSMDEALEWANLVSACCPPKKCS